MRRIIAVLLLSLTSCVEAENPAELKAGPLPPPTSSDPLPPIPNDAIEIYRSVLAYRTAKDPFGVIAGFGRSTKAVADVYGRFGLNKGRSLSQSAHILAYSEVTPAQADFADGILAENVFDESGVFTPDVKPLPMEVRKCPLIIYVPGVQTTADAAATGRQDISTVARARGMLCNTPVIGLYNPTAKNSRINSECLIRSIQLGREADINQCGIFGDFIEASRQIADLLGIWPGMEEASASLVMIVATERARGRPVMLVGHSQGAMVISQALSALSDPKQCVRVLTIGSPLGRKSFGQWQKFVDGLVLKGGRTQDIILSLGQNDFYHWSSELTRQADKDAESANLTRRLMINLSLHSVNSYLSDYLTTNLFANLLYIGVEDLYKRDCSWTGG